MGYFRFRRVINLIPGLRLNLSKSGASTSLGIKGLHYTIGPQGTRTTVGLPGSGLSYTDYHPYAKSSSGKGSSGGGPALSPVPSDCSPGYLRAPTKGLFAWIFERGLQENEIELAKFKTETRLAFVEVNKPTAEDNLLVGDFLVKLLAIHEQMLQAISKNLEIETSLDGILLMLAELSFKIRLTMAEPLQALNFISIRDATGGKNSKEDVVELFKALADALDDIGQGIRNDINDGVPWEKIYSSRRPHGRNPVVSFMLKQWRILEKLFAPGKFSVEWGSSVDGPSSRPAVT